MKSSPASAASSHIPRPRCFLGSHAIRRLDVHSNSGARWQSLKPSSLSSLPQVPLPLTARTENATDRVRWPYRWPLAAADTGACSTVSAAASVDGRKRSSPPALLAICVQATAPPLLN